MAKTVDESTANEQELLALISKAKSESAQPRPRMPERPPYRRDSSPRGMPSRSFSETKHAREARTSPFEDQFCEECNNAYGLFMSHKRRILSNRVSRNGAKKESRLLTKEEYEQVKAMIPSQIEHLDTCKAQKGGFDND